MTKPNNAIPTYRRVQTIPVYEQIEGMVVLPSSSTNEIRIVTAGNKGLIRKWKAEVIPGRTPELVQTHEQPKMEAFGDKRGGYMGLLLTKKNQMPKNERQEEEEEDNEIQDQDKQQQKQLTLIAVDAEHNLSFLDYHTLRSTRTIVGHNDEVLDLKIIPSVSSSSLPSSPSIVVATNSPQVRVFDLHNFSCTVLDGHTSTVLCVDASPCGRYVTSCGKDKTMRLWQRTSSVSSSNNDTATMKTNTNKYRCVGIAFGHTVRKSL
jgi:U3 small nucleolar RNA-associated protein 13